MRRDAQSNRKKIIAATKQLLAAHPGEKLQMTAVARAAGVGVGTLYRNFATPAALGFAVVDADLGAFIDQEEGKEQDLYHLLLAYFRFREEHQDLLTLLASDLNQEGTFLANPLYERLNRLFCRALPRQGDERAQRFAADALIAILRSALFRFQREQRGLSKDELASYLVGLFGGEKGSGPLQNE